MADGGLLLIERRREDRSPNATVIGPDGTTTGRFEVGDGVEDAVIDAQGRLWVSYFDEGTTGGDPLSKNGLSRFDADSGMPDWVYPQGSDWLVDCYALNVTGQEAWAYGYGSFGRESHRLIHVLEDGNVRQFEPGMKPAFGLLVYEERIVFVGFDVLGRPTAVVSEREGSRVGLTRPLEIRTSAKLRWRDRPRMVGRGDRLYFVIGAVCWVASLEG
jgi:hypothetical protein